MLLSSFEAGESSACFRTPKVKIVSRIVANSVAPTGVYEAFDKFSNQEILLEEPMIVLFETDELARSFHHNFRASTKYKI